MKTSLKNEVVKFIRYSSKEWTNGGELERFALSLGYKASNVSRRARELVREGILENRYVHGTVEYKLKPAPPISEEQRQQELLSLATR